MIRETLIKTACHIFIVISFTSCLSVNAKAHLTSLNLSHGVLTPKFNPTTKYYKVQLKNNEAVLSFFPEFREGGYMKLGGKLDVFTNQDSCNVFVDEGKNVFEFFVYSRTKEIAEKYTIVVERDTQPKSTKEVPVLIVFVDFDREKAAVDNAKSLEKTWNRLVFGYKQGQGNHYWNEVSQKQFAMVPAKESFGLENNGFAYVKLKKNRALTSKVLSKNRGVKISEKDWLDDTLKQVTQYVNFKHYDKNNDLIIQNSELSLLFVLDLSAQKLKGAGAEANIKLNHFTDGVKIENYARTLSRYTTVGVNLHELAHHTLDLDHLMEPKNFSLMGMGYGNQKDSSSVKSFDQWGTNPAHLTGYSKVRAQFEEPILITDTTLGVKLHKTTSGKYNIVKVPVLGGFLYLENKQPDGYDSGIPFYQSNGGIFASEVVVTERVLKHRFAATEEYAIKDFQSFKGHHDSFTIGGFEFTNISKPGSVMTFDIYNKNITPQVEQYFYQYWTENKTKKNYRIRNNLETEVKELKTIDFQEFPTVNQFITLNSIFNTGEVRQVVDLSWTTSSQYLQIKPMYMNRDKHGTHHAVTLKFEFNKAVAYEKSVLIKFIHHENEFLLQLNNLPEK